MSLEDLGNIGEFVAAVAVVVSLIYLAVQIRDNTRSLQAASLQSVLDGQRDHSFLPLAQSAEITSPLSTAWSCRRRMMALHTPRRR